MTDAIERSSDVPVDEVVATGERLKQAREAKGVSIEDAASRLNISAKYIAALEAANMQALPGLPFVRGYIRSYCRYLDLPGDELIASFNHEMGVVDAQNVTTINKVGSQVKLSDTPIRLSVYLFFLAVVGISIWWWQTQSGHSIQDLINFDTATVSQEQVSEELTDSEAPADEGQVVADPTDIQTRLAARQQQLMEQSEQIEAESNALTSQQDRSLTGSEEAEEPSYLTPAEIERLSRQLELSATDVQTESTEANAESAPGREEAEVESTVAMATERAAETESQSDSATPINDAASVESDSQEAASETVAVAEKPKGLLVMRFVSECWISIRDGSGKLVFANTKRAGDSLELALEAPANLLVGRVSAVSEASFNDQSLDLQTGAKKDVARLVLQ